MYHVYEGLRQLVIARVKGHYSDLKQYAFSLVLEDTCVYFQLVFARVNGHHSDLKQYTFPSV